MRIVFAEDSFAWLGGSHTYTLTVAEHLQRLAHDVLITTRESGITSELAAARGLRVVALGDLPDGPAVAVVGDAAIAYELARRRPRWPQVIVVHSDIFDAHLPPAVPQLRAAIALHDRVEERLRAMNLDCPIVRLSQPIDVERFKPTAPLRTADPIVLLLGNYVQGERLALIERACDRAGMRLRHVGAHGEGWVSEPETAINEADIVIGKSRVIYEALACGRAAYVYDFNGGEGWVTAENVARLGADNFGGRCEPVLIDADRLTADLRRYDPTGGLAGRDYVVAHHAATVHAAAVAELLRKVAGVEVDGSREPMFELARMARVFTAADSERFSLRVRLEEQARTLAAVDHERAGLVQECAALTREYDAVTSRVHELDRGLADAVQRVAEVEHRAETAEHAAALADGRAAAAEQASVALTGTRRWRAISALLSPIDRMRSGR